TNALPVVTTPCCGQVVSDGLDGFIVPQRDSRSLANVLHRYLAEPGLLENHSQAALEKSCQFTMTRLASNLSSLEEELRGRNRGVNDLRNLIRLKTAM